MILITLEKRNYISRALQLISPCYDCYVTGRVANSLEIRRQLGMDMEAIALEITVKLLGNRIPHTLRIDSKIFTPAGGIDDLVAGTNASIQAQKQWKAERLKAWGLYLTLAEWLKHKWKHPSVTKKHIELRISRGWSIEEAIAVPVTPSFYNYGYPKAIPIHRSTMRGRLESGWTLEATVTTPAKKAVRERYMTAFGEKKILAAWIRDPRVKCSVSTLYHRLYRGWPLESAIATPPRNNLPHDFTIAVMARSH